MEAVFTLIFFAFSLAVSIFDIRTKKIPDILTFSLTALLFILRLVFCTKDFILYAVAAVTAFALLFIVRKISANGLGLGDIKYAVPCALYAGPVSVSLGLALSALLAFVWIKIRRIPKDEPFPFAPFMSCGILISGIVMKNIAG